MTVREINAVTRYGGSGRNVYLHCATGALRVTRARMKGGAVEVKVLHTGQWTRVLDNDRVEVSL